MLSFFIAGYSLAVTVVQPQRQHSAQGDDSQVATRPVAFCTPGTVICISVSKVGQTCEALLSRLIHGLACSTRMRTGVTTVLTWWLKTGRPHYRQSHHMNAHVHAHHTQRGDLRGEFALDNNLVLQARRGLLCS